MNRWRWIIGAPLLLIVAVLLSPVLLVLIFVLAWVVWREPEDDNMPPD